MIISSNYEAVTIPDQSLPEVILRQTRQLADKPALIDGPSGRTLTYGQLGHLVERCAAGLAARQFGKGQVFGIYCPNLPEYAVAFHGVVRAGGTCTTANPLYTAEELGRQLKDCSARFLLTIPPLLETAQQAAQLAGVEEVFVLGDAPGATPFDQLLDSNDPAPDVDCDPATDLAVLPYSSGTTGVPKGVMLTQRNLIANIKQFENLEPTTPKDVLIGVLPFFHIYGMTVIMNAALSNGATVVTMPRFDLEQFLGLIQQYGITRGHIVPPIVLALAKHPLVDQFDLSSLKVILSGAAPLGADLSQECATRLNLVVKQGYGMTELSPVTHVSPEDPQQIRYGAAGHLLPNTEARIVDVESGKTLGYRERGELHIRGPQVMKGYLNNPEATAETVDEDGWLRTGDIAEVDEEGNFWVVDRVKELIKYKGFQVPPAELEALLLSHPDVNDVGVVPYPDEEAGEIPRAFVVRKPGAAVTEAALMDFVAERVSPQKRVRKVEFIDAIPKSASGKILRRELRNRP